MTDAPAAPRATRPTPSGAIELHRLAVEYQAIFGIGSDVPIGFEALARLDHPTAGRLLPADFFPPGLDDELGWRLARRVLDDALRHCARWRARQADVNVSVNLSPGCVADLRLPDRLADELGRHGLPPAALTIEVTEHQLAAHPDDLSAGLARLAALGVRTSLDDFGTGESNLARLRGIRVDEVKIDRSFVTGMATGDQDRHIVEAVTRLGHLLGSVVVAEGVESQASLDALADVGVDRVQGFHLHRPGEPKAVGCEFFNRFARFPVGGVPR